MRVLAVGNMFPPHHLGGYELVWHSAVRHLRAAGHRVRVVTSDYRAPRPQAGFDESDVHRELRWYWRDHEFPSLSLRDRYRIERHNSEALARHLAELSPDVVSWWAMGGMSMSLLEAVRRRGLPAVGLVHDDWLVYGPRVDGWQRAFSRPPVLAWAVERLTAVPTRLRLGESAAWIFVSETVRRRAAEARANLERTGIAHSGIDVAMFSAAPEGPWRWRLLYVGRIDPRKGVATAVRALALLPEAQLRVAGGGDERHLRELASLASELGVSSRVAFEHRPREELPAIYAAADAVVFPTLWEEPWGLVPLEAMAVGRPVIATGTGGSGEYLRDGENCVVFRPKDDPGALAAAVRTLAADAALRRRLRENGQRTAERYTEEAFNGRVRAALEDAAS